MTDIKRSSTLLGNLLLLTIVCIVLFGICEVAIRLLYKQSIVLTPRYHTSAEYGDVTLRRIRPNMTFTHTTVDGSWKFQTNAQGFRNYVDFDYEKPMGVVRIVTLGDSHTQGHECHQDFTYSAVIQQYLRSRGVQAEVLNTGVSGFSTAEELLLLEREMLRYDPDFVVLGFYANDYEDNLKAGLFELADNGSVELVKHEHIPGVRIQDFIYSIPGVQWLGENSYFYSLLFNTVWDIYKRKLAASARIKLPDELVVPEKSSFSDYEVRLSARLIQRMAEASHSAGAELIVMDVPLSVSTDTIQSSIVEDLHASIVDHVDLLVTKERLKEFEGAVPLHVPHGGRHITEITHTILGIEVAAYFRTRLGEQDARN